MQNTNKYRKLLSLKRALLAGVAIGAACMILPTADAENGPPTEITQCGTVIKTSGYYVVKQPLQSTSKTVDCIQIAVPGVNLDSAGDLSGPGTANTTAAGIRILSSVTGVQLFLGNTTIQGFGVGIAVEGSGVTITGVSEAPSFMVEDNAAQGVLISNASAVFIDGLRTQNNGQAGLELSSASGVIAQDAILSSNGKYGLYLHSSSGNQFYDTIVMDNQSGGIYVGEPSTVGASRKSVEEAEMLASHRSAELAREPLERFYGPHDPGNIGLGFSPIHIGSTNNTSSQDNVFFGGALQFNFGPGITVGRGDYFNIVTSLNGQMNQGGDAVDQNGDCTHNSWVSNQFSNVSPSCIQ